MAVAEPGILARTARGAGWVVAWRMATRVLGLVSTLVLARLLVPGDFGLVALATSFAFALDACFLVGVEDQIVGEKPCFVAAHSLPPAPRVSLFLD